MRVSKLLKELNLSFDSLKLYEQYLDVTLNNANQKITEDTYIKIIALSNSTEIQNKLLEQKAERLTKKKIEFEANKNKTIKLIGLLNWYYNRESQGEYGFLKSKIGDVYFRKDVVVGVDPHFLKKDEYLVFDVPYYRKKGSKPKATRLTRLEDETDFVFLICEGFKYLGFLSQALNVINIGGAEVSENDKIAIEKLFNTFLNKDKEGLKELDQIASYNDSILPGEHNDQYIPKIANILNISQKLNLNVNTDKLYGLLDDDEKFELFKETGFSVLLKEYYYDCISFILEGSNKAYVLLDKIKQVERVEVLLDVYQKILEGQKINNEEKFFDYLKENNVRVDFNQLDSNLLITLWHSNKLDFFPADAFYNKIKKFRTQQIFRTTNDNYEEGIVAKIDAIFRKLSEKEIKEIFYRSHYGVDKIKEVVELITIFDITKNTPYNNLKSEFYSTIFKKSTEFIRLYLFVENYTDELDYHNSVIYTGLLSATQQKIFFKKVLMLIETNVLNVDLEDVSKIIVFEYEDNIAAKSIDGVGLDFTLSIILRIANDLKNNIVTNQQTMFEIIANQIKTPQDFLEINGFFTECSGRTTSEALYTEVDGETQVDYITKKTDYKPRFATFCDGRKAIHKKTNKPILSTNEQFEFWWCENSPCFEVCRGETLPRNWRNYTLEDVLRILGVAYSQHQYEIVLGVVNKVNRFLEHLKCNSCSSILRPNGNSNYSFYRVAQFSCTNENCKSPDKDVYLSHCLNGNCPDIIDSRTTVKCLPSKAHKPEECGWYICNNCLSCCSSEKLLARKSISESFGYDYSCHTVGHRDLGIICCPKCGTETKEKGIDLDKYNKTLDWFKSKINTDLLETSGQRADGKWWFRWRQGNIETDKFRNTLLKLKNLGFQVPNYNTNDSVQFISESFNDLNTISDRFECENCNHIIDLSNKEEFYVSRVRAVKSFHSKIFPRIEHRD
ncbi:MAG: hypothetical protein ACSHXA_09925 [Polaribacter sp.]|uniref:hypothetical protein n=1 Tax=Polaribacter sp. TaxID=1920175 RepID=UPI003EF73D19